MPDSLLMTIPKRKTAIPRYRTNLFAKEVTVLPNDTVLPGTGIIDLRMLLFMLLFLSHHFFLSKCSPQTF